MLEFKAEEILSKKFFITTFTTHLVKRGVRNELKPNEIVDIILTSNIAFTSFKQNLRLKKNAKKTKIVVLDIDEPQEEYPTLDSVKERVKELNHLLATTKSHQIQKNGVVCNRYRLIIFFSEFIDDPCMYKNQINNLEKLLGLKSDSHCVDMGRLFFPSKEVISFNFSGKSLIPHKANPVLNDSNTNPTNKEIFKYKESNIELNQKIKDWIFVKQLGTSLVAKRERFIRILICQKYLLLRSELPQAFISNYLGIKRDTLSNWIEQLINLDLLVIADEEYGLGWKARSYRALNELSELIMKHHGFKDKRDCLSDFSLPLKINDGEWHRTLFIASFKFKSDPNPENFISWVKSISGWEKKTRLTQAINAFNSMKGYIERTRD
jgi:hypothetical protein